MQTNFDDIIQKIDSEQLWDFTGGIHPKGHKQLSNRQPIAPLPIADHLYVPIKQHIGVEGHIIVKVGQHVLKGQPLTQSSNPYAVPIHAPTSGTISAIDDHVSSHPSGLPEVTIKIDTDQKDTWIELTPLVDYQNHPKMDVLSKICDAGISGMGGAGFPSHIKLSTHKEVEFLIINGVECEPYITADDRLMREHAWQIRQGIDVLTHLLSPKKVIIAIEDNKPEAIEAMQIACRENSLYSVCQVPTKYPSGGEKQLIQILTNREVPAKGLPIDIGVISQNVGTCYAISDAIFSGKPLIQRVVTVTGQAVNTTGNYWTLLGTPIKHLLQHCNYQKDKQKQANVIMGGPMMGFTVTSDLVPVVKITNCILVPTHKEIAETQEQACIRCGACADVCPASLLPQQMFWHAKAKELDKVQEYNLFDCIECGACAYVCPSEIPLVHYYRVAKAEIKAEKQEKQLADKARERFEKRAARLEADQKARDEKHRLAAEARKQAMASKGNDAKDKIAAALARAKAKKEQLASNNQATSPAPNEAAKPEQASASANNQAPEATQKSASSNQRVQAAIARAKAKKAAAQAKAEQNSQDKLDDSSQNPVLQANATPENKPSEVDTSQPVSDVSDSKDEHHAAQNTALGNQPTADNASPISAKIHDADNLEGNNSEHDLAKQAELKEQAKKARIASAVAKAKAKRDAQKNAKENSSAERQVPAVTEALSENEQIENKKRRIAAAVAKAKAKKLAEKTNEDNSENNS
ncbi:electron transport complex subunit RsxC [Paraglaciecola aquimarina]|uniref:Ion-translocating oxidoreductase complex subunit C n=1 Tax=Paraglaciecola aquimarina TaxID=1235557 RepID=A0ABU3T1Q1_9ALTE|nr:electron transport complex subunit RsxC [Paraglaciecola aquimarina]MDU0356173.1 electron transport complex subunit RsxC [Paraglaciecola aquimarina]